MRVTHATANLPETVFALLFNIKSRRNAKLKPVERYNVIHISDNTRGASSSLIVFSFHDFR